MEDGYAKDIVDDILEEHFEGKPADHIREDQTGCSMGFGGPWLSPMLCAEIADAAFKAGQRNPEV